MTRADSALTILIGIACIPGGGHAAATLQVVACGDCWPYVGVGSQSQLTGFDVQFWGIVYSEMRSVALQNADAAVLALLGDVPPKISIMPREKVMEGLKNSTFDIGLCGFEVTSTDHAAIDYSPVVSTSGYRPIVKYAKPMVSGQEVLLSSFKGFNESAVFALLLLLILSVVNAHIVWAAERGENLHIHKEYGWGVFDSWWMSLVTALTVGYGDKVPVTFVGRLFICAWMFIGTYCVGMFTAALTEDFLSTSGAAGRGQGLINIRSISELSRTVKVGTVDAFSTQYVAEAVPGIGVAQFVDSITLLNALASGIIDVAVDDRWRSRWMVEKEPSLKDKNLLPVGDVFAEKPRALAVSRQAQPGGDGYKRSHAILPTINQAVMRIMYGSGKTRFESIHNSWMLQYDPVTVTPYAEVIKDALYFWNWVYGMGLLIFMCMWWACVVIHYRREIIKRRVKDGLLLAMGLKTKFSQKQLRASAKKFFREVDADNSKTVDAGEIIAKLESMNIQVTENDLNALFGDEADLRLGDQDESTHLTNMLHHVSARNLFGQSRSQSHQKKSLSEEEFQRVVLMLALGDQIGERSIHAPVMQVNLEQAVLTLKEHLTSIERRISKVSDHTKRANSPESGKRSSSQFFEVFGSDDEIEGKASDMQKSPAWSPPPSGMPANMSTIQKPANESVSDRKEYQGNGVYRGASYAMPRKGSGNPSDDVQGFRSPHMKQGFVPGAQWLSGIPPRMETNVFENPRYHPLAPGYEEYPLYQQRPFHRYEPPPGYRPQTRPGTSSARVADFHHRLRGGFSGSGFRPGHNEARSGTVTLVENNVLAEHVVERVDKGSRGGELGASGLRNRPSRDADGNRSHHAHSKESSELDPRRPASAFAALRPSSTRKEIGHIQDSTGGDTVEGGDDQTQLPTGGSTNDVDREVRMDISLSATDAVSFDMPPTPKADPPGG